MSLLKEIYRGDINIADGGLGTTLEDVCDLQISNTPLWSTRAVTDNDADAQGLLADVHLSFLRAGARTLLTSTYQAAFSTFEREGYSRDVAGELMSKAVAIADVARSQFCAEKDVQPDQIRIALSLGTFGATLSPMQDYGGIYPPPYGPKAYSATEDNTTSFGDDSAAREKSIDALAEFHAERVLSYATNDQTWNAIDCIAFETIALAREVTAIRRAVTKVDGELQRCGKRMKPWWITAVFPGGRSAETRYPGGENISAEEVATLMTRVEVDRNGRALAAPSGIGINCTDLKIQRELLGRFKRACQATIQEWPWLVIKPNGGDGTEHKRWADELAELVKDARQRWGGLIVGGCCKTRPMHISELRRALDFCK
ncbi:Homocysteine S-methyltransferase [Phlebopus sp. FC_14]|nr:Homocysteine S-methyltransferase [Phlebopus sp. FC_14]